MEEAIEIPQFVVRIDAERLEGSSRGVHSAALVMFRHGAAYDFCEFPARADRLCPFAHFDRLRDPARETFAAERENNVRELFFARLPQNVADGRLAVVLCHVKR